MATILGARGVGDWSVNELPQNYMEMILYKFPSGAAKLTAFMALLESKPTTHPVYNYFIKSLHSRTLYINNGAGYAANDTSLVVDDSASGQANNLVRAGDILLNTSTNEQMRVVSDPSGSTTITVSRGIGTVAPAAMTDNDQLMIISSAYEDFSNVPSGLSTNPSEIQNYVQILRQPFGISGTAAASTLATGDGVPMTEMEREALERMSISVELMFLFGQKKSTTVNGEQLYTSNGIINHIRTNSSTGFSNLVDAGGTASLDNLLTWSETAFSYGSPEKLLLCGNKAITTLNKIVLANSTYQIGGNTSMYGMNFTELVTPHGTWFITKHPLFTTNTTWNKYMLSIDTEQIMYRYMNGRDLDLITNREDNGVDGAIDEFFAQIGGQWGHADTHMLIQNVADIA